MTIRLLPSYCTQVLLACLAPFAGAQAQELKVARPPPRMQSAKEPSLVPIPLQQSVEQRATGESPVSTPRQEPATPRKGEARAGIVVPDFSRVHFDDGAGSHLWARGATYKASFGADGFTYIPFLGSDAPQNHPVRMSVSRASVGGLELPLTAATSASRTDSRITLDRGSLLEVYDLQTHYIEQTFVIADLPVRGELSLRLDVETDLTPKDGPVGLEFACSLGSVRYGDVTVIDASGSRIDVPSRLSDGRIAIDVPAAFVASARLPLRVDPVISTFLVNAGGLQHYNPDIAYDAGFGRWCLVYEEIYSGTDHDVYCVLLNSAGGTVSGLDGYIDITTEFWGEPSVANNALTGTFLCVATVDAPSVPNNSIRGRLRSAGANNLTPPVILSGSESGSKSRPSVGGDPSLNGPTYFFVVWQRRYSGTDDDIHGQMVRNDGSLHGSTVYIEDSSGTQDRNPSISKSDGLEPFASQEWNIVWQRYLAGTGQHNILGAQIHWDGGITSPAFLIDSQSFDEVDPVASPLLDGGVGPRPWMVACTRDLGGFLHNDIVGFVLIGSSIWSGANLTNLDGSHVAENQVQPSIETDGSQFIVAFSESYQGSISDYDVYASSYWFVNNAVGAAESRAVVDSSSRPGLYSRIASKHSAGGSTNRFGLTWVQAGQSNHLDVLAGFYDSQVQTPISSTCFGDGSTATCPCSNNGAPGNGCANSVNPGGAHLSGAGSHDVSSDTFVLTGSGMPGTATCLFFQGTLLGTGSPFGDGLRCVAGSVTRLATKTCVGGTAVYPGPGDVRISLKGSLPPSGGQRQYQVWYRNAGVYCTASTFNLTNGLSVPWIP